MSETTPRAGSRPSTRPVTWPRAGAAGADVDTAVSPAVRPAAPADAKTAVTARSGPATTTRPERPQAPVKPAAGRTSTAAVTTADGGEQLSDTPAAAAAAERRARRTRRARLRISRVDPWSVMKTALLFGIAGGIMFIVATYFVMTVIEGTGLWEAINKAYAGVLSAPGDTNSFDITTYINTRRATGLAALVGAIDVVIFTALATVFSFLYNLSATMLGGLEITLAED